MNSEVKLNIVGWGIKKRKPIVNEISFRLLENLQLLLLGSSF